MKIDWIVKRGYSIDKQLQLDGLSFDAFELIQKSTDRKATNRIKGKIVSRLAKELRSDCLENSNGIDIAQIKYGAYCIAVGTGFEMDYTMRTSRVVYIGSGAVYERINAHLKDKLFEFASVLRSIPLRFYITDLSSCENALKVQRNLEQALLQKFSEEIDTEFLLLNSR
ncbi:MAG: hypothetical protein KDE47_34970, partial [Caldilineaceae bacterium]|nr:hypothetical protein [Caldilineaceae bacterium]